MKRKLAAWLAACIFLCTVPCIATVEEDRVKNGDFSNGLSEWSEPQGASVKNGELHFSGEKAVYISQRVQNVLAGNTYVLSGRYKAANGGAALKIEWQVSTGLGETYSGVGTTMDGTKDVYKSFTESADWKDVRIECTAPPYATAASILVRKVSQTSGDVYWDDISLTGTFGETPQEEVPFTDGGTAGLSTDKVFYYTEETEGKATVAEGHIADSVRYTLMDGENRVWEKTEQYGNAMSFSLEALVVGKMYTMKAEVLNGTAVVAEGTRQFYRVERPTALMRDGTYRRVSADGTLGETVNPVIMYTPDNTQYDKLREAGVTVVQDYVNKDNLDAAKKAGVMILGVLYIGNLPAGHPGNVAVTRYTVSTYKNHEALFGWIIMDEPYYYLTERSPYYAKSDVDAWLANSYRIIREEDPHHPVFVMENGAARYASTAQYADILGIDPYISEGANYYDSVYEEVSLAEEAVKGEKPVYAVLQSFRYYDYLPTASVMRHMVYQARLAGAEGIGYFRFKNADTKIVDGEEVSITLPETPLWEGLCDIADEIPFLFSLPKAKEACGVVTARKGGKTVHLAVGTGEKLLEAVYSQSGIPELLNVNFLSLSEETRLRVEETEVNSKRFVWTDAGWFLCS